MRIIYPVGKRLAIKVMGNEKLDDHYDMKYIKLNEEVLDSDSQVTRVLAIAISKDRTKMAVSEKLDVRKRPTITIYSLMNLGQTYAATNQVFSFTEGKKQAVGSADPGIHEGVLLAGQRVAVHRLRHRRDRATARLLRPQEEQEPHHRAAHRHRGQDLDQPRRHAHHRDHRRPAHDDLPRARKLHPRLPQHPQTRHRPALHRPRLAGPRPPDRRHGQRQDVHHREERPEVL